MDTTSILMCLNIFWSAYIASNMYFTRTRELGVSWFLGGQRSARGGKNNRTHNKRWHDLTRFFQIQSDLTQDFIWWIGQHFDPCSRTRPKVDGWVWFILVQIMWIPEEFFISVRARFSHSRVYIVIIFFFLEAGVVKNREKFLH